MQDPVIVVVVGLNTIVTLLVGLKALLKPLDPDKQFITRGELQSTLSTLKTDIKAELLDISKASHEQTIGLHELALKVERLVSLQESKKSPHGGTP